MSKSRRDKFEEQLRALQTDIHHLSHKLSVPASYSTNGVSSLVTLSPSPKKKASHEGGVGNSKRSGGGSHPGRTSRDSAHRDDTHRDSAHRDSAHRDNVYNHNITAEGGWSLINQHTNQVTNQNNSNSKSNFKSESFMDDTNNDDFGYGERKGDFEHRDRDSDKDREESSNDAYVFTLTRERNDLLSRLEHAQGEVEELRRVVVQGRDLQNTHDRLKQDHDSLQISLESSERIRRQQKELINLLQRSASVAESTHSIALGSSLSPSIASTAAENRSWLNTFETNSYISPRDMDADSLSMSVQDRKGTKEYKEINGEKPTPSGPRIRKKTGRVDNDAHSRHSSASLRRTATPTQSHQSHSLSQRGMGGTPSSSSASASARKSAVPSRVGGRSSRPSSAKPIRKAEQASAPNRFDDQLASSISSLGLGNGYVYSNGYSPYQGTPQSLSDTMLLTQQYDSRSQGMTYSQSGSSSNRPHTAPPSALSVHSTGSEARRSSSANPNTRGGIADVGSSSRKTYSKSVSDLNRGKHRSHEIAYSPNRTDRYSNIAGLVDYSISQPNHIPGGRPPIAPTPNLNRRSAHPSLSPADRTNSKYTPKTDRR